MGYPSHFCIISYLEDRVLGIVAHGETGTLASLEARKKLFKFSQQELESLLDGLQRRGLMGIVKDPFGNLMVWTTAAGKKYAKENKLFLIET